MVLSCSFKDTYNIYCPGCGGTRAMEALSHFDIIRSLYYNPAVISLLAFFITLIVSIILEYKKHNIKHIKTIQISSCITIGIILGNCIIRNTMLLLFGIDWLGDILK